MPATTSQFRGAPVSPAMSLLRSLIRIAYPYQALGQEHTLSPSGAFLIANHRSIADAAALFLTSSCRFSGPAKAELFEIPVAGRLLRRMGAFPLQRDGMDYRAARAAADIYRAGGTVLIFPEGHRSRSDAMLPFSPSVARLIIKLEAPLIPAGIAGTAALLPPGQWRLHRSPFVVAFGAPFELTEFYGRPLALQDRLQAATIMQDQVAHALAWAEAERQRMLHRDHEER